MLSLERPHLMLVAGEPSGDLLGGRLMAALRERRGEQIRFSGIGGPQMAAQGLDSLFPISDLSVMGFLEVLPRLPKLLSRLRQAHLAALRLRPDALVTIDSPGFSFRLAKRLAGAGIPRIHYVAPTVWAWRPGRAKAVAGFLEHLMAFLPFEPAYFEPHGLACTFVGHPAAEVEPGDGAAFRCRHGIDAAAPLLAVLPGSRRMELGKHLPIFEATLARLRARWPELVAVVPAASGVAESVITRVGRWSGRNLTVLGEAEKRDAFAAANGALAVSGTVTLELALSRTPAVIAYRGNPISAAIVRRLALVRNASLVNILLQREEQPELLQANCRPEKLAEAVANLLTQSRERQLEATARTIRQMLTPEGARPSLKAADVVLQVAARATGLAKTPPASDIIPPSELSPRA